MKHGDVWNGTAFERPVPTAPAVDAVPARIAELEAAIGVLVTGTAKGKLPEALRDKVEAAEGGR